MKGFDGRVMIVAGAATGIGAASARRLAGEGAKVVVGDINIAGAEETAHQINTGGGTAIAVEYDQGDERSIANLIHQSVDHFGSLGGLHANAADIRPEIMGRDLDLSEMDVAIWEHVFRIDVIGFALIIREAVPHLVEAGGGGIVCTSSDASHAGSPTRPAYGIAKAGVNALCRHVASRWGKDGVRCNAIAPGLILTEAAKKNVNEEFREKRLADIPNTRLGDPDDIAGTVAFLLSDDGVWVNGQTWGVNGGASFNS